jgi:hypothetical protein
MLLMSISQPPESPILGGLVWLGDIPGPRQKEFWTSLKNVFSDLY